MNLLPRYSRFTVLICADGRVSNSLMGWLTKIFTYWWPVLNEDKIPVLHWHQVKKGSQRPKEIGRLEWVYHVQTAHPREFLRRPGRHTCHSLRHWEIVRKGYWSIEQYIREVCGCFPLWEMFDQARCCHWDKLPDFTSNNGIPSSRGQVAALNHERQGVCVYCKGQQGFISSKNALTHRGLWLWLIDHDIPRSEMDEQLGLCLVDKNLIWVTTIKSPCCWLTFQTRACLQMRSPWLNGRLLSLEEWSCSIATCVHHQSSPRPCSKVPSPIC